YKEDYSDFNEISNRTYDATFICVPTEMNEDGSANITEIMDIVPKVQKLSDVVIIKSAVPVGTVKALGYGNIVISPEYYGTTQHSLESPNFVVIGANNSYIRSKASRIYQAVKSGSFRFIYVSAETAELAKYMENCWLATKVTFCNEFADVARKVGIDYNELRECFIADERVNPSHTFVYEDKPYYDSHCLNKDIPAFIKIGDKFGVETPLLDSVNSINIDRKAVHKND
ncbi:MAG: hypothetical protein KBT03_04130, partial [Bacteroidales bacterium]|nr:hypothetical protein [Candidatus Scybalousia scybalohippi]